MGEPAAQPEDDRDAVPGSSGQHAGGPGRAGLTGVGHLRYRRRHRRPRDQRHSYGPAKNHWPITGLRITIEPGAAFTQRLPAHDRAFLYVLSGRVRAAGRPLGAGEVAWSDPVSRPRGGTQQSSTLELHAPPGDEVANLILFAGQPIGDPVSVGGLSS